MTQSTRMIIVPILLMLKLHNNEKYQQYLFENTIFNGVIVEFSIRYLESNINLATAKLSALCVHVLTKLAVL